MWKYIDQNQINDFLVSLELLNCNKNKYINTLYALSNNVEKNYKKYNIKKRNGKTRTIYAPSPILKHIQRQILKNLLYERAISNYACAYRQGHSLKDNVLPHVGKKMILKLDIKDFFDNIDFIDIYNSCFPIYLYPKSIGHLLAYLCCYDEHLPQGAPTSAYISNLVMRDFDEEIGQWCRNQNISYTRYSDDMTFSGNFNIKNTIKKVIFELKKLGLQLNYDKIHVIKKRNRQLVTGIVVNQKVQVSKQYRKKIRQEIFYIKKFGIGSHLKKLNKNINQQEYLRSLYGKILFILQINNNDKEFLQYKNNILDYLKNI